jgi:hypothetical protein
MAESAWVQLDFAASWAALRDASGRLDQFQAARICLDDAACASRALCGIFEQLIRGNWGHISNRLPFRDLGLPRPDLPPGQTSRMTPDTANWRCDPNPDHWHWQLLLTTAGELCDLADWSSPPSAADWGHISSPRSHLQPNR